MSLWRGETRFLGNAATQGSKRLGRNPATGAPVMIEVDSGLPEFRNVLKGGMLRTRPKGGPLERVAVKVRLTVFVRRPAAHYNASGDLHEWAPKFPAAGKDLDKVQRAVGDSGTGIWWRDDRQVSAWDACRLYGEVPEVRVTAEQLEPEEPERKAQVREAKLRETAERKEREANERKTAAGRRGKR